MRVDLSAASVTRDELPIRLSAQEFLLLSYFVRHSGVPLSREQILGDVWGYDADSLRSLWRPCVERVLIPSRTRKTPNEQYD